MSAFERQELETTAGIARFGSRQNKRKCLDWSGAYISQKTVRLSESRWLCLQTAKWCGHNMLIGEECVEAMLLLMRRYNRKPSGCSSINCLSRYGCNTLTKKKNFFIVVCFHPKVLFSYKSFFRTRHSHTLFFFFCFLCCCLLPICGDVSLAV